MTNSPSNEKFHRCSIIWKPLVLKARTPSLYWQNYRSYTEWREITEHCLSSNHRSHQFLRLTKHTGAQSCSQLALTQLLHSSLSFVSDQTNSLLHLRTYFARHKLFNFSLFWKDEWKYEFSNTLNPPPQVQNMLPPSSLLVPLLRQWRREEVGKRTALEYLSLSSTPFLALSAFWNGRERQEHCGSYRTEAGLQEGVVGRCQRKTVRATLSTLQGVTWASWSREPRQLGPVWPSRIRITAGQRTKAWSCSEFSDKSNRWQSRS